jgi:hypothetical protein
VLESVPYLSNLDEHSVPQLMERIKISPQNRQGRGIEKRRQISKSIGLDMIHIGDKFQLRRKYREISHLDISPHPISACGFVQSHNNAISLRMGSFQTVMNRTLENLQT